MLGLFLFPFFTNNKGPKQLHLKLQLHKHFSVSYTPLNKLNFPPRRGLNFRFCADISWREKYIVKIFKRNTTLLKIYTKLL